jgi:hypothetical protein|tara:strand:+ start:1180 stop:1287 length:108 start_codon:yes stop_codon:yes gene_type:complete
MRSSLQDPEGFIEEMRVWGMERIWESEEREDRRDL